jgi:hypothetical protein
MSIDNTHTWKDRLLNTHTIVTHKNCPDGTASAMICHAALPKAEVLPRTYDEEDYENLPAQPGMLFVDIIPPKARFEEFLEAGAIVLDHHKKVESVTQRFVERGQGVFADEKAEPGVSGALLAFRHVWSVLEGPHSTRALRDAVVTRGVGPLLWDFAFLAGIRDTWQVESPHWADACAQGAALSHLGLRYLLSPTRGGITAALLPEELEMGRILFEEKVVRAKEEAARAHLTYGFAFINDRSPSDFAEALRAVRSDLNAAVGFSYVLTADRRLMLVFSLRSIAEGFDVGEIAARAGGGGHTRAAGFSVPWPKWAGQDLTQVFFDFVSDAKQG